MEQQLGMIAVKKTKLLGALSEFDHSEKVEADLEYILSTPLRNPQARVITFSSVRMRCIYSSLFILVAFMSSCMTLFQTKNKKLENGFSRDSGGRAPVKRAHKYSTNQYGRLTTKSTNL